MASQITLPNLGENIESGDVLSILVSEGDTELGLIVKNLLDSLDPEAVLGRLPMPLAHAARRMMMAY